ncbi:hypothetical protein TorRG33x02_248320 [Trema orientale]|uniref:Uncharacterized protein n=1 Tax=Trema orientale TaxID=63057 RepID=A0A2P5DLA9_TREOI|nr:hypothetical protein TorRG33x02_248320 [Trema orientale]
MANLESKGCELASELRNSIQNVDNMIEIEVGNMLCCHLSDLLLVISENSRQYSRISSSKYLLKLLLENKGRTNATKRTLSVIEVAERELLMNRESISILRIRKGVLKELIIKEIKKIMMMIITRRELIESWTCL